jgi:excisionase family DNA binding protein
MDKVQKEGFNRKEGATYLGISENTFARLLRDGRINCVRVGRRVIVAKSELDRFLQGS